MYKISKEKLQEIIEKVLKEVLNDASDKKTISDADVERIFHLDEIPYEEMEQQYQDLGWMASAKGFGGPFIGDEGKIIKEEATHTLSIEETKEIILYKFNLREWQFDVIQGANGITLAILIPDFGNNIESLNLGMEACGWSYSNQIKVMRFGKNWVALTYDPMFQENVADEARKFEYLYHWTLEGRYPNIKREGLRPRSENFSYKYPNRLHLLKGNLSYEQKKHIGAQLFKRNKSVENNGRYILLKIDTSLIPKECEIYYDPRYERGYYTKEAIPPIAIKPEFGYDFLKDYKFPVFK